MLSVENVATPATATTVVVPDRVPPPGLVPIVAVTVPVKPVTVLPEASCTATLTAGAIATPAVAPLGCTANASWAAAPGVTSNEALVVPASPVAVAESVYPVPLLSMPAEENVATPPAASTVVVPRRVAPLVPVPAVIVSVTFPLKPVTVLPSPSCTVTCTAGLNAVPAAVFVGCTVKTRRSAGAAVMVNGALVAPVGPVA